MTQPVLRLLSISLLAAILLPAAPALAGWRDGYYFAEGGGENDYYPRPPAPVYTDEGWGSPYQGYRDYRGEGYRGRAYGSDYDEEPDYAPSRPRRLYPPRNVEAALPERSYVAPVRPRAMLAPPRKPKIAAIPPAARPVIAQAPALPVARPNLESMDFDSTAPVTQPPAAPNHAPQ